MSPRHERVSRASPFDSIGWLPDYEQMFGSQPIYEQVLSWVRSYPVEQWLAILGRIQTAVAGDRSSDKAWIGPMANGVLPRTHRQQLVNMARDEQASGLRGVFHDHQVSVLQQLVILNSPETGSHKFASEQDLDVLGRALFAVFSLLHAMPPVDATEEDQTIQAMIHDFYRSHGLSMHLYVMRAFDLWQIASDDKSDDVRELFRLFREATGLDADKYIVGGFAYFLNEIVKSPEDLRREDALLYAPVTKYTSMRERECRSAFTRVSSHTLDQIREMACRADGETEDVSQWSLIALKSSPLLTLSSGSHLVLSLTHLAQAMVTGIRHTIRSAAIDQHLPSGWNGRRGLQRIEGCFGRVFENYVAMLLQRSGSTRVERIPESTTQRADLLLLGDGVVAVIEVKSGLFAALPHGRFMSIAERRKEVGTRIRNGLDQLHHTIRALRSGDLPIPSGITVDWTVTPIIPVLITEELLPIYPLVWEHLIAPHIPEGLAVGAGLPTGVPRVIGLSELEAYLDTLSQVDLARELYKWSCDADCRTSPLSAWVRKHRLPTEGSLNQERFETVREYVARTLQVKL